MSRRFGSACSPLSRGDPMVITYTIASNIRTSFWPLPQRKSRYTVEFYDDLKLPVSI
jgi:hypothetical protein